MKIAVPVTGDKQVDGHFGHCEYYSIFSISAEGEITGVKTIPSVEGCGCKSNIAGVLAADGVTIMLAGGIGGGAINVLFNSGIDVVRGCSGDAAEVVKSFVAGTLTDSGVSCHQHAAHQAGTDGHQCGH
ncbi:MAG: NifB/NifX family molybdenum-iron cluster-binding protein [Bacteroidota bacterium]